MTKKLVGLFASVALLGSGVALAEDKSKDQQSQQQQVGGDALGGSGTSGQHGQMGGQHGQMGGQHGQAMTGKQITGTVVKSSSNMLHLRTDNGIIPLKVDRNTQFQDPNVKRVRDLKEGQQVRASFDIQGTDNLAKSISVEAGVGGGGLMDSDTGINQQPGDLGGSGTGNQDIGQDKGAGGAGDVGGGTGDVGGTGGANGDTSGRVGGQ